MAHIPMDDITELWSQTPEHDWEALKGVLEEHKGKAEGISDNLVDMMINAVGKMEQEQVPYPDSQQQLYEELNQHIEQ